VILSFFETDFNAERITSMTICSLIILLVLYN